MNIIVIFYYFRDVIGAEMLLNESDKKIGGPGLTVEIDESMFGKRRYHRGRILGRRQMWVLGGVCRYFIHICEYMYIYQYFVYI